MSVSYTKLKLFLITFFWVLPGSLYRAIDRVQELQASFLINIILLFDSNHQIK